MADSSDVKLKTGTGAASSSRGVPAWEDRANGSKGSKKTTASSKWPDQSGGPSGNRSHQPSKEAPNNYGTRAKGEKKWRKRKRKELVEGVVKLKFDQAGDADKLQGGEAQNPQKRKQFCFIVPTDLENAKKKYADLLDDGSQGDVFAPKRDFKSDDEWALVQRGDRVQFYLKFDGPGKPVAKRVRYAGDPGVLTERTLTNPQLAKKEVYTPFWPLAKVQQGLSDGTLVEGTIRVNPKKPNSAFVDIGALAKKDGKAKDLLVLGHLNRNRAVHGDRVVVRVLPEREEDRGRDEEGGVGGKFGRGKGGEVKAESKQLAAKQKQMFSDPKLQKLAEKLAEQTQAMVAKRSVAAGEGATGEPASANGAGGVDGEASSPAGLREDGEQSGEDELQNLIDSELAQPLQDLKLEDAEEEGHEGADAEESHDEDAASGDESEDEPARAAASVVDQVLGGAQPQEPEEEEEAQGFRLAQVVYIGSFDGRKRNFVCTLCPNSVSQRSLDNGTATTKEDRALANLVKESDKFVKAMPVDRKFPWILIYLTDAAKEQLKVPGKLNKFMYWGVTISKWDETSILPLGQLGSTPIGEAGDAQAEVMKALEENELADHNKDFGDEILDEVDAIVEETTEKFEQIAATRIDLRKQLHELGVRVMTIDPKTARDLDDAIHVRKISSEITEFGVHIADVAHFVKPGSQVDKMAKFRCTSVYMPDRVLPMLPHALCNHLCSLNPNENKCAFSVFFRINKKGELMLEKEHEPWIAKTVINTCCRFNYDQVQEIYDGKSLEGDDRPVVYHGARWEDCVKDLFLIYRVCSKIREQRFHNGALSMHKSKMIFKTTDDSHGKPTSYGTEVHSPSHWVIEELMLLANKSVARVQQRHEVFDTLAVLRNHPPPDEKKSKRVLETMALCGIEYSNKDAGTLHECLGRIMKIYGLEVGMTAAMLTMKCGMRPAAYFIGEDESPHHFALNFEQYTHFTSPIRRYADVMVHRVLNAILEKKSKDQFMVEDMDDDDRAAVPEGDDKNVGGSGAGKKFRPDLNTDDLSDDEYDKHGKLITKRRHREPGFEIAPRPPPPTGPKVVQQQQPALTGDGDEGGAEDGVTGENNPDEDRKCQANIALTNQCKKCNAKKKAAKDCQEELDRAWFCMLLRSQKAWWYRAATVTEIAPDGITVFAHEIGKEKKISTADLRTNHHIPDLFVKGVKDEVFLPDSFEYFSKSWVKATWTNRKVEDTQFLYGDERPDLEEQEGAVIGADAPPPPGMEPRDPEVQEIEQDIHLLSVVPIVLIPTNTVPIDFVMLLCSPYHAQWRKVEISDKERRGFNNAPIEQIEDEDDDDSDNYGTKKRVAGGGDGKKGGGGKGKKGGTTSGKNKGRGRGS